MGVCNAYLNLSPAEASAVRRRARSCVIQKERDQLALGARIVAGELLSWGSLHFEAQRGQESDDLLVLTARNSQE